jgi:hypothetical protein
MWLPDKREGVDVVIGIVGFFALAFFVVTVVAELTHTDALGWAITLLALVLVLAGLLRIRHKIAIEPPSDPEDSIL